MQRAQGGHTEDISIDIEVEEKWRIHAWRCTGMREIMLCIIKDVGPLHLIKIETSQETSLGLHKKFTRIMSPICGECDWCGWSYANFPCQKGRLSVVYGSCQIQLATLGILAQSWIREMLKYEANSLAPKLAWLFGSNFPPERLVRCWFFFFRLATVAQATVW